MVALVRPVSEGRAYATHVITGARAQPTVTTGGDHDVLAEESIATGQRHDGSGGKPQGSVAAAGMKNVPRMKHSSTTA